ncbi:MAG: TetR/AcrR family transcriptional regulator, transcriptional repressor for nem operon [Ilumatobacteraceae bacterium]|jgi:TetR/AcrR family transcriptional repressor of nem operon|nr:TetR/AcrR family transcriptional regulator, transcriptional repressor for nem operon [Ilumatobacteraceae bacterium]
MGERTATVDTAERMLDVAERLVQVRGFNGVSYADVAAELGITKAALHYHFASKAALGEALIHRYTTRFQAALLEIDRQSGDALSKLSAYAAIYLDVLRQQRMCLCGMLAAEYQTLPPPMRDAVVGFFDINEAWLERVLDEGKAAGTLHPRGSTSNAARVVISTLEGAMLVARLHDDPSRLEAAREQLLAELG